MNFPKLIVIGYYDRNNIGDETYKIYVTFDECYGCFFDIRNANSIFNLYTESVIINKTLKFILK